MKGFGPFKSRSDTVKIIILVAVFTFIILSRFAFLAEKPFHHDESQYAAYSYYNFKGYLYKYDPILHGPFLFYFNMLIYAVLGATNFTARLGPALLGALIPLIFLLFSKRLGLAFSFILILLYAISPIFTYFNRFLGHDTYVAFFAVLTIYFFLEHLKTRKIKFIYFCSSSLAFLFLVKVNAYIYAFIFITFLLMLLLIKLHGDHDRQKRAYLDTLKSQSKHLGLGILLFFFIFFLFYSSFFNHPQGFIDGFFLKSLGYWAGQHAQQRIKGTFDYYIPILAVYELPLLLIFIMSVIPKLFANRKISIATFSISGLSTLGTIILSRYWTKALYAKPIYLRNIFDKVFHIQEPYQLFLAIILAYAGSLTTYMYFKKGKLFLSFTSFWLFFSLLIYSYAGEKVPWLTLNILLPMLFYCAMVLRDFLQSDFFTRRAYVKISLGVLALIALAFTIFNNYRVSIKNPADPKERLVYVQTSTEMLDVVETIESLARKTGEGNKLKFAVFGQANFPLAWYLRNYPFRNYSSAFPALDIADPQNKAVIIDYKDLRKNKFLKTNFDYRRVKLREWWVPDTRGKISLKDIIDYYLFRKVFSPVGHQDIVLFVRKDLQ